MPVARKAGKLQGAWTCFKPGTGIEPLKKHTKIMLDPVPLQGGADDVFKDTEATE